MRVVHIGFQYGLCNTGGAAIASTRLHLALLKAGVASHYVCVYQREDGTNVHVLPKRGVARMVYFLLTKFTRCLWKFTPYRRSICLNIVPMFGLERLLAKINPDVVHVQWINADVCSFEQLSKLPYKIVLNLHDLFLLLPGVGPDGDERYRKGLTCMNSTWLERWMFKRRLRLVEMKKPIFVGPSEWVCEMCRQSVVGNGSLTFTIPNIIDSRFQFDSLKRKRHEKMVMLFGAFGGRGNRYKGWSDCEKALRLLPEVVKHGSELRIFGEMADTFDIDGLVVSFLGEVPDPGQLVDVYNDADLFLFPSVQETQGMTKMEAMLCGLPVIAFDRTACAEGIIHCQTGWVADDGDIEAFAKGIEYYYDLFCNFKIPHQVVAETNQRYSDGQIERILGVYLA